MVIGLPARAIGGMAKQVRHSVSDDAAKAAASVKLLGQLLHSAADLLAESWRGPDARVLTPREKQIAFEVFGQRAKAALVKIVPGPGLSTIPRLAFETCNPAITIGNTIYIKPNKAFPMRDLSTTIDGVEMLAHEFMHVIQYRELGYARFLARYGVDMRSVKYDDSELYRYWKRQRGFKDETLEGQAEMVGNFTRLRTTRDPKLRPKLQDLKQRLSGTGIHGL